MKVAIVHDWFVGGGAEKVALEISKMYPKASIYTSYCSAEWQQKLGTNRVKTSYMQAWPFSRLRKFLPLLRAIWFSRLDLSGYDLVISSSGAEAKAVKVKKPSIHINYCHAPTHYYWSRYDEYMRSPGFGWLDPLARLGLKLLVGPMRFWDFKAAQRPDYMIANSSYIKDQIKKYYRRDCVVIHPPVEVEKFKPKKDLPRSGFLIVGRQTPYKRFDLAVAACTRLSLPLIVAGDGPEHAKLKKMAGPTIKFVGRVTDSERIKYFQAAEAFIFPGIDDFGIVAVEALAAGTPVVAYDKGGALDYVSSKTGLFFTEQKVESLASSLGQFSAVNFNVSELLAAASSFAPAHFRDSMSKFIKEKVNLKD